jgi:hypothetical protein
VAEGNVLNAREMLRRHGATAAAVGLCAVHFSGFRPSSQPILTDVRYFLYFAWRITEGAVPHLDYFENKTQLATFVGACFHALGELVGADPLLAIRWGYLTLAAAGGLAVFAVLRRLGRDRAVAGGLGLLAYCSFGLLGVLPAVGNIPKLLMALGGSVAALLLYRRRWFWAGAAGALAFMDWQVGGLVGLAALATAALYGTPRLRAVLRVVAGGAAGLAPFLIYYGANGALVDAARQVVGSSWFRGSTMMAQGGLSHRLDRIAQVASLACPSQTWLFGFAGAGMAVVVWWLWRRRREASARLLVPLAVYHFGVVAFSLVDFQYYGDFFLLLHSAAFFLGVSWVALHAFVESRLDGSRRALVATVALVLACLLARPGPLRPRLELVTPMAAPGATLADQRYVAQALDDRLGEGSVAFMENAELFFLIRRSNSLPMVYCNLPVWSYFRQTPGEPFARTCARLLLSTHADAIVPPRFLGYDFLMQSRYSVVPLASDNGRYAVNVALPPAEATALP